MLSGWSARWSRTRASRRSSSWARCAAVMATSWRSRVVVAVAAALVSHDGEELLARAAATATTTRDRQLVAIAAAHLAHDEELLDALVRDHLADHPDSILAAWIATQQRRSP
jgi:hypothetical protein